MTTKTGKWKISMEKAQATPLLNWFVSSRTLTLHASQSGKAKMLVLACIFWGYFRVWLLCHKMFAAFIFAFMKFWRPNLINVSNRKCTCTERFDFHDNWRTFAHGKQNVLIPRISPCKDFLYFVPCHYHFEQREKNCSDTNNPYRRILNSIVGNVGSSFKALSVRMYLEIWFTIVRFSIITNDVLLNVTSNNVIVTGNIYWQWYCITL